MRILKTGAGETEISCGALTPLAWHASFGDDGLTDAAVRIDRYLGAATAQAKEAEADGRRASYIDGFPASDVLRCAYAMAWTADYAKGRETPPFERWLSSIGEVNVYKIAWEVSAELTAGLFRA